MKDSHSVKPKNKTAIIQKPHDSNGISEVKAIVHSKTTILKPVTLINISELMEIAEQALNNERIVEGFSQYEQIFTRFQLELTPELYEKKFCELFTKIAILAIGFLNNSKKELCFSLLIRCEKLLTEGIYGNFPQMKSLIFNHLGCYYRRIGNIDEALRYYKKALEIIQSQENKKNSALTFMNFSAIYRQIGKFFKN